MSDHINQVAARWWADRLERVDLRGKFEAAILSLLPEGDWIMKTDYDPDDLLLEALHKIGVECRGMLFSSKGLLPCKTILRRDGGVLLSKEGYGAPWTDAPA
jgi:hypothetical protein